MADRYVQQLESAGLAIERATERTPDEKQFHVFKDGEVVGSFKKLPDAQRLFARLRDESGWTPPQREQVPVAERLAREREMHQRTAYLEYWSQSHRFRGGGRPKRK